MAPESITSYLTRLTNREVAPSTVLQLSSAQRARLVGWLESQGKSVDTAILRGSFTAGQLADDSGHEKPALARPALASRAPGSSRSGFGGVGIDIQSIAELVRPEALADLKGDAELRAIFSLRELSYAEAKGSPAETLAGIFAAKEALRKADPQLLGRPLVEIEVLPDESGAPCVEGASLSISHSAGVAVAVAIVHAKPVVVVPAPVGAENFSTPGAVDADPKLTRAPSPSIGLRRFAWLALFACIAVAIALWVRTR